MKDPYMVCIRRPDLGANGSTYRRLVVDGKPAVGALIHREHGRLRSDEDRAGVAQWLEHSNRTNLVVYSLDTYVFPVELG